MLFLTLLKLGLYFSKCTICKSELCAWKNKEQIKFWASVLEFYPDSF